MAFKKKWNTGTSAEDYDRFVEVKSHSSAITNKSLRVWFDEAMDRNHSAFVTPNFSSVTEFFSIVNAIYDQSFGAFSEEDNEAICNKRNQIYNNILYFDWKELQKAESEEDKQILMTKIFETYFAIKDMYTLIIGSFQKQKYFFRTGVETPKGIDNSIKILQSRGGIFEKSG
jgi:hypothetical protein